VADLEKVLVKKIRNALQELFAIDLGPHKQEVNDLIMERYYLLVDQRARDSTTEQERRAEMEAQDAIMAARLLKTPLRSARATRVTKLTTKRTAPKNNPFNKPMGLSGELANVVGESTLSRPQVVKKLWEYIKEHQLQNPSDKRVIICDNLLRDLFKKSMYQ
jgi:upstream activation factor subunit UAF30